jgi:Domain of unknown function (DUF4878)
LPGGGRRFLWCPTWFDLNVPSIRRLISFAVDPTITERVLVPLKKDQLMKKSMIVLLGVMLSWLLVGCGGGGSGPGDVVKKYLVALGEGDTKTAMTCIDPAKRKAAVDLIQFGSSMAVEFTKKEGGIDSVTILNQDLQGDRARVGYLTKTKSGRERRAALSAEKIKGTWYVAP